MAADNKMLGQFDLVGIPPAPRGVPQIEVTFDIDANGIVNVNARDKATGKEQQITIQSSGGLSDSDIEQMVRDAEMFASKDKERKELIEAKNTADNLVYSSEKSLDEHKAKLPQAVVDEIESAITALRTAAQTEDVQDINAKVDALQKAVMKIGEELSRQAGGSGGGADDGAQGNPDEGAKGAEDAEYTKASEEKKEEK